MKIIGFSLALCVVGALWTGSARAAEIIAFNKDTIVLYDNTGRKVGKMSASSAEAQALIGASVAYDDSIAKYKVKQGGKILYLSDQHIKTNLVVGTGSAEICGKTGKTQRKDGASGSGASCQ